MRPTVKGLRSSALGFAAFLGVTGVVAQSITPVPRPAAPPGGAQAAPAAPLHIPVTTPVEVTRKGRPGSDIFLGVYLTLDRDCKVGATPRVEFGGDPRSGKLRTRPHPINLRDVPGAPRRTCIGTSPNGQAVIFRPERRFRGEEKLEFRVVYPNGDVRAVTATIMVE
jgi:hypothetical protein